MTVHVLPSPVEARSLAALSAVCRPDGPVPERLRADGMALVAGPPGDDGPVLSTVLDALGLQTMPYRGGNTPRRRIGTTDFYTATEYSARAKVTLHQELSYSSAWPSHLFFRCARPAESGGESLYATTGDLANLLPADLANEFDRRGVAYTMNLRSGPGVGRTWMDTFDTDDPDDAERRAVATGWTPSWLADHLRLRQTRPAFVTRDGRPFWFNQADQWHGSTLDADIREVLMASAVGLPHHSTFGDGAPIPDSDVGLVRRAWATIERRYPLRANDLLVLDNVAVAHGRMPYRGERRLTVALAVSAGAP